MAENTLLVYNQRVACKELLFETGFAEGWEQDFEIPRGSWKAENGVLTGEYLEEGGALIYTRRPFPGDILLDFYARMIPPCSNDLNFTFRARGWDYEKDDADLGYIAGLNGWWTGQLGIEKYPSCSPQALTRAVQAVPGTEYHIQAGITGSRCFIAIDGSVLLELSDPNPLDAPDCCRAGLGVYASRIAFRQFRIYRTEAETLPLAYLSGENK